MRVAAVALFVLLALPREAAPHRLDDYLQATRMGVNASGIVIELDLTPGALIADRIFPALDRDQDGLVSAAEVERYGRVVLNDLALEVDGVPHPLTLTRADAPSWPEIREGLGTIRLEASADVRLSDGTHRIRFENRHRPDIGVYLANALMPAARDIAITAQHRDAAQRRFEVEIKVGSADRRPWILAQTMVVFGLLAWRAGERRFRKP